MHLLSWKKQPSDEAQWHQYNKVILNSSDQTNMAANRKRWLAPIFICLVGTCATYLLSTHTFIGDRNGDHSKIVAAKSLRFDYNPELNITTVPTGPLGIDLYDSGLIVTKSTAKSGKHHNQRKHEDSESWISRKVDNLFDKMLDHLDSSLDKLHTNQSQVLRCQGCVIYNITSEGAGVYDCRQLKVYPYPFVCIYSAKEDIYVSADIIRTGVWERHIVEHIALLLEDDKKLGFIDLGANIGVYSLVAAKLGHDVLAVEPFAENAHRLSVGAMMNNVQEDIMIVHNALSDTNAEMGLQMNEQNQGDVRLNTETKKLPHRSYGYDYTNVITLNDLTSYIHFTSAIMKIDIQGFEHRIFRQADRFFDSVYVPYIFMEWVLIREFYGSEITQSEDKDLAQDLVDYLIGKGYEPFSAINKKSLPVGMWYAWPEDVYWKHELVDIM